MLSLVLSALAALPPPDVAQAQRLYQQARYPQALAALGPDCLDTSSPGECERVRASTHVALGEDAAARAAFARMLALDPRAELPGASPKLQGVLREVKQAYEALTALSLAPVRVAAPGSPWRLEVAPPAGLPVERVTVYVDAARLGFERVPLTARGTSFGADYRPPAGAPVRPAYFVETVVAGGAKVTSGSSAVPRDLSVARADVGSATTAVVPAEVITAARVPLAAATGGTAALAPPVTPVAPAPTAATGMPRWGIWALAGGAAAALAGGVTWAVVRNRKSEPGRIVVGIKFEDQ